MSVKLLYRDTATLVEAQLVMADNLQMTIHTIADLKDIERSTSDAKKTRSNKRILAERKLRGKYNTALRGGKFRTRQRHPYRTLDTADGDVLYELLDPCRTDCRYYGSENGLDTFR